MMPRLVHTGGAVVDYVYRIDRLPTAGVDRTARSHRRLPGGGFNVLVAARRTGMAAACAGQLGTGPDADLLRAALAAHDIEVLLPSHPKLDSGNSVVLVTDDAERSFVSWPGAEAQAADLSALPRALRQGDWVLVTGYSLSYPAARAGLLDFLEQLPPAIPLVFDPAPVIGEVPREVLGRILSQAAWVSANRAELAAMTGDAKEPANRLLAAMGPQAQGLVIRAGEAGCMLHHIDGKRTVVPGYAVQAVDSNGAGDTHIGTFISALAHGAKPEEAASYANAAAALSVMQEGGATAPDHTAIADFLEGQGAEAIWPRDLKQAANHQ